MINNDYQSGVLRSCDYYQLLPSYGINVRKVISGIKCFKRLKTGAQCLCLSMCPAVVRGPLPSPLASLFLAVIQCVSGHVVRASFSPGRSSRIRH